MQWNEKEKRKKNSNGFRFSEMFKMNFPIAVETYANI